MAEFDIQTVGLKDGRTIVIRSARDEDAEGVLQAIKLSMVDGQGMILTAEEYNVTADDVKTWIKAHNGPKDVMLLAEHDGIVVGSIEFHIAKPRRCAHWGTISMAVSPGWRGSGLGNTLLARLLDWAISVPEITKVILAVRADNAPAIALYKKHGFVLCGCDKAYLKLSDGSFVDDLRMERFIR